MSRLTTYDPKTLEQMFIAAGGQSYIGRAHTLFHLNRIEDYNRLIEMPNQWNSHPFRLTVYLFTFLTKGNTSRSKGLNTYEFGENTFFFLPANEISANKIVKEDTEGFYCHFNIELLTADYKLKDLLADFPFLNFNCYPLISVTPELREKVVLPHLRRLEEEYK